MRLANMAFAKMTECSRAFENRVTDHPFAAPSLNGMASRSMLTLGGFRRCLSVTRCTMAV